MIFRHFFLENRYFDPFPPNEPPPTIVHDIHRWKAVNLTFPGAMPKISFLRPVSRENFGNALGMTSIHYLTVCLIYIPPSTYSTTVLNPFLMCYFQTNSPFSATLCGAILWFSEGVPIIADATYPQVNVALLSTAILRKPRESP